MFQLSWCLKQQRICLQCRSPEFDSWFRKIPWRRKWLPTPVFLPGKSHRQRSLVGYIVHGGHKELDMTEQLSPHGCLNPNSPIFLPQRAEFEFQLSLWAAIWPQANHMPPLWLFFLICNLNTVPLNSPHKALSTAPGTWNSTSSVKMNYISFYLLLIEILAKWFSFFKPQIPYL